jgi:hypothetical protein
LEPDVISQNSTVILGDRMSQKIHFCESWLSKIFFPSFNNATVLIFHELAVESYHFQQRTGHKMIALRW